MYQANTNVLLDRCEKLDEKHPGKETFRKNKHHLKTEMTPLDLMKSIME